MKIAVVGLPQVGKKTLFRLLTGQEANPDMSKGNALGLAEVRDVRFNRLVEIYSPQKRTPAQMEFILLPDLGRQADRNTPVFKGLEQVDVICHLVRAFEEETVFHIDGNIDPSRDIRLFAEELQLNDLLFLEKRLERLAKEQSKKKNDPKALLENDLLTRMRSHLESGHPLHGFTLTEAEQSLIASYPLLTLKTIINILNVGENQLRDASIIEKVKKDFSEQKFEWIAVSAKIEEELSLLEGAERDAFLKELGIDQPALDKLTLLCYSALGLISFFTVGPDEVRAWTIRQGSLAPQAARAIHSDIERGFIRAEVMKYEDLIGLGSEQKVRESGKFMQKGKTYPVEDGDIINFLFNV